MPKTRDIVAEIAASIPPARPGSRPWWERASEQHGETLAAIHAAWHRGDFGTRKITAARVISRALAEFGITIGEQGVVTWLEQPKKS